MRLFARDLTPGTEYAIQVRSSDGGYSSEWSPRIVFTTESSGTAPGTPGGISWTVDGTSFSATWDQVTLDGDGTPLVDFQAYEVEIGAAGKTPKRDKVTSESYLLSFEQNRAFFAAPQGTVTFRVRTLDNQNNASDWSPTFSATNPAPATVANLTAQSVAEGIQLKWDKNTEADISGYRVYVGTTAGFTPTTPIADVQTTSFFYYAATITTYYFKVMAYDVFGTESTTPATANAIPKSIFTTDLLSPKPPVITNATIATAATASLDTTMTVTWTAPTQNTDNSALTDLAGYHIRHRPVGATGWTIQTVGKDETSTVIDKLRPYTNYDVQMRSFDWTANNSTWTATTVANGATNTAPPTPQAPAVSGNTMQVQVRATGQTSTATPMPSDITFYEVYGSTTSGFTPSSTNMLGTIPTGPAMVATFNLPASSSSGAAEQWYVKVIAVDNGGLKSAASAESVASPNLIGTINIADASISSAKIQSLSADKIVAGTINTDDITIATSLIIGNATNDGEIRSFDYSYGTQGFRITNDMFEVNQGSIKASALEIQIGNNIVPPEYSSFEAVPDMPGNPYQNTTLIMGRNIICSFQGTSPDGLSLPLHGDQYLATYFGPFDASTGQAPAVMLARSPSDFNIQLEEGQTYIFSFFYRMRDVGYEGTSFTPYLALNNNEQIDFLPIAQAVHSEEWHRATFEFTCPPMVTSAYIGFVASNFSGPTATGFQIDCVQIEPKLSSSEVASPWKPPGLTKIDGALIRTGRISSISTVLVNGQTLPNWSIDLEGDASFNALNVRGSVIVGTIGENDGKESYMQSANYLPGTTGWRVNADGTSEFSDTTIKGSINATQAQFSQGFLALGASTLGTDASLTLRGALPRPELKPFVTVDTINSNWPALSTNMTQRDFFHDTGNVYYRAYVNGANDTFFVQSYNGTSLGSQIELKPSKSITIGGVTRTAKPYDMFGVTKIGSYFYGLFKYGNLIHPGTGGLSYSDTTITVLHRFNATNGNMVGGGTRIPRDTVDDSGVWGNGGYNKLPMPDTLLAIGKDHDDATKLIVSFKDYKNRLTIMEFNTASYPTGGVPQGGGTNSLSNWPNGSYAILKTAVATTPGGNNAGGNHLQSVAAGSFDFAEGRLFMVSNNSRVTFWKEGTVSGVNRTLDVQDFKQFDLRESIFYGGVVWNGGNFVSVGLTRIMRQYSGYAIHGIFAQPTWVAYSFRSSTASKRTQTSPMEKAEWGKRLYLQATLPTAPAPGDGVTLYAYQGVTPVDTSAFVYQADGMNPTAKVVLGDILMVGANPPATNEFVIDGANLAQISTESGGFILKGDGSGAWPALQTYYREVPLPSTVIINSTAVGGQSVITSTVSSVSTSDVFFVETVWDVTKTSTTIGVFIGELFVDGVAQPKQSLFTSQTSGTAGTGHNGARNMLVQRYYITGLAAGNHTFNMRGRTNVAAATFTTNGSHTVLCIEKKPAASF